MPMTAQNILMKSSGSMRAMVMERSVGDVSLRGPSKRDALLLTTSDVPRARDRPPMASSGSVRGSAAGGQARNEAKPAEAKRTEDVAQRDDALSLRWR